MTFNCLAIWKCFVYKKKPNYLNAHLIFALKLVLFLIKSFEAQIAEKTLKTVGAFLATKPDSSRSM